MRVLVVGTGGSIVSGISTAADQMVRALEGDGHVVERLTAGERMRARSNTLNVENVTAVLADARAVFRRARRGRADLVWIHTFGVPTLAGLRAAALVAAARLAGRPAVVHLHAFALERFLADGGPVLRLVLRLLARAAATVVVLHEAAAEAFTRATGAPVRVLPNWVEVDGEVAPLPPRPPLRLVFVGGLVRRKGAPQLIEAMRELDDLPAELRLVGGAAEDRDAGLNALREAAADLVATGRVQFAGELGPDGVRAELRAAHLLVLPSEAEGTPMAMLEAMAEGRPVLVTGAGDMGAVVEAGDCGWVMPDRRPATIAAFVRRIAEDPVALEGRGLAARRVSVERHSAAASRARVEEILAVSTSGRRRSITTT